MNRRTLVWGGLVVAAGLLACGYRPPSVTRAVTTPFRAIDRMILTSVVRNPIQPPAGRSGSRVPLGVEAPSFELSDALGETFRTEDFRDSPVLVVAFLSNSCREARHIQRGLVDFAGEYQKKNVITVAINSNDPSRYPEDDIESIAKEMVSGAYTFPYLIDVKQEVAKAYLATSTPEFYVFDRERRLAYHGRFDDSRPGSGERASGADLRAAVDAVLAGSPVSKGQKEAPGCAIAWRTGNEPEPKTAAITEEPVSVTELQADGTEVKRDSVVVERPREPTGAISGTMTGIAAIIMIPFKIVGGVIDFLF